MSSTCEWKAVVGYEGVFEVSRCGKVRRIKKAKGAQLREKKQCICNSTGYPKVSLWYKNKGKTWCVHRLVAMAWVEGDHSLSVNHKDGIKTNNCADNLEWISLSENTKHQHAAGLASTLTQYPNQVMKNEKRVI